MQKSDPEQIEWVRVGDVEMLDVGRITTKRPVIQVDFDRMMLGKFHEVTLPLWGEIGTVADLLLARLTPKSRP